MKDCSIDGDSRVQGEAPMACFANCGEGTGLCLCLRHFLFVTPLGDAIQKLRVELQEKVMTPWLLLLLLVLLLLL